MKTLEDFYDEGSFPTPPTHPLEEETVETKPVIKQAEGFIIKEIEMKGFMRYVQKTSPQITFPNKFTVITGKTGSGKTSILDAITFALYKRTSRTDIQGIKISDICKPGGYVRIVFMQNGEDFDVERGFSSSSSPYLNLKRDGKNIEGNIKELEKVIEDVIGLDYDGFRNSTFVRQEEMKELGAERGADRLAIFQKLFRLETFEKAQALVSDKFETVKKNISGLETEMRVRSEQLARLPQLSKELEQKMDYAQKEKEKLDELSLNMDDQNKKLKALADKHDEFSSLKGRKNVMEDRLNMTKKKLDDAKSEAKKVEPLKKELNSLEKAIKDYEKLRSEGEALRENQQKYQTQKRELEIFNNQKETLLKERDKESEKLSKRVHESEKRIKGLSTKIGKDEAFTMLRKEGSLSERVDRIEKEIRWLKDKKELVLELNKERSQAKKELKGLVTKTSNINANSFVLSEIEANIKQMKKDSVEVEERYRENIEGIEGKMEEVESNLKDIRFGEKERKRLAEIRGKVSEMQKKRIELEKKRKKLDEIGDLSSLIKDLESQKEGLDEELKDLDKKLSELSDEEKNYQKTKQVLEEMQKEKEVLQKGIFGSEGEIKRLTQHIKELKDLRERIKETDKELNTLREKGEIYSILKEKVFHKRGIVIYAIDQLLPQLSLETSSNLSDMTDGRFSKVKLGSYVENNRYGIRIEVFGADANWHDVQEFSGGEKTQINAAVRFAIAKELASMPQVGRTYGRMKTLFIDEGDLGSLDTESSRQLFVKKLFDMGEFFEKIILITHLTEVADRFPGRIMVYMTPEQESRIEVMS